MNQTNLERSGSLSFFERLSLIYTALLHPVEFQTKGLVNSVYNCLNAGFSVRTPEQEKELMELVMMDELTGIANRRHFYKSLETTIAECNRYGRDASLLLLDIDHFKGVNDTYGHPGGDYVLKMLAGVLSKTCRPWDTIARVGGEEFALILPRRTVTQAESIAERLRRNVEDTHFEYGSRIPLTVSIGVTGIQSGVDPDKVIKQADVALYRAKEDGRNNVKSYVLDEIVSAPILFSKDILSQQAYHA